MLTIFVGRTGTEADEAEIAGGEASRVAKVTETTNIMFITAPD
jgi:hypothetical protein